MITKDFSGIYASLLGSPVNYVMRHKSTDYTHCASTNAPLTVNPEVRDALLTHPEFKGSSDEELVFRAKVHLGLARLAPIKGIIVRDRAMAIAVLLGMHDWTEYSSAIDPL